MSHNDPFDLIPDKTEAPSPQGNPSGNRGWLWWAALLMVAVIAFGAGAALFTLNNRLSEAEAPTPPPFATATPTRQAPAWISTTVASLVTSTPAPTSSSTPKPLATSTTTATATATPECDRLPAPQFAPIHRRDIFGCPLTNVAVVWAAWEPFERGAMLWRSDNNRAYVFYPDGQWREIDAAWEGQPPPSRGNPPPGLTTPERGFGWVWGTRDEIFFSLGWARTAEKGFCADVQVFEQGFFIQGNPTPSCTAEGLYNHAAAGDWQPLLLAVHRDGRWSGLMDGSAVAAPAPTRTLQVAGRPEAHGIFQASRGEFPMLDGRFDEWPANWSPIGTVVEGMANYTGLEDLAGEFQTRWSPQALFLAVRVRDDRHRAGPPGSDLWRGDAIEIHFDARLVEDYTDATANGDDYQIGVSVGQNKDRLLLYRWLPYDQEGPQSALGMAFAAERGYDVEIALPWSFFGVNQVNAGDSFGFNISLSDNDGDMPAQETVLSASPARTTHDNPTEWGTLVLMP